MKGFLFVVTVATIICSLTYVNGDESDSDHHHAIFGVIGPHDKLLRRDVLIEDPSFTGKVKNTYAFPTSEHSPLTPYTVITAIKAIDHYTDGNGGSASIVAGGVSSVDVSIRLKSQLFRGYHFTIEIYGH